MEPERNSTYVYVQAHFFYTYKPVYSLEPSLFVRASYMTHYLEALTQFINNFEPRANFQITLTDPR